MKERIAFIWTQLLAKLESRFLSRVGWFVDSVESLGSSRDAHPWVLLIGREWYSESIERMPGVSWLELRRILAIRHGDKARVFFMRGRTESGSCLVHLYRVSDAFDLENFNPLFIVPESALLSADGLGDGVTEVRRGGRKYFLASGQLSQMSGGMVSNAWAYGLSVGVRAPESVNTLDEITLRAKLSRLIFKMSPADWLGFVNLDVLKMCVGKFRRPIIVLAASFGTYLAVSTLWLLWEINSRFLAGEELSNKANALLIKQREIDDFSAEYQSVVGRLGDRRSGVAIWWLASEVWKQNGAVTAVSVNKAEAVIQGTVPSATVLLSALERSTAVESVKFNGPIVRLSDEAEQFSLTVRLRSDAYLAGDRRDSN